MKLKNKREISGNTMLDVLIALLPAVLVSFVYFGTKAIILVAVSVISAALAEYLWCKIFKKENSLWDLSFVVTGVLIALNVSSLVPFWAVAIASVVAIIIGKMIFGGAGKNIINPAVLGIIILMIFFYNSMNNFADPFQWFTKSDTILTPPPLSAEDGAFSPLQLLFGLHKGAMGETSSVILLLGGLYLVLRKVINPIIPLSFIGSVALLSFAFSENILISVFSGSLILVAIFMATDYATSPSKPLMQLGYGIGCGILTFILRRFTPIYEGTIIALLIMNILLFIGKKIYDYIHKKRKLKI